MNWKLVLALSLFGLASLSPSAVPLICLQT